MNEIDIEKEVISGIPVLVFAQRMVEGCPLVFFNHGFTSAKESGIEFAYHAAEAGLVCVLPDAYLHGERIGAPLANLDDPQRAYVYPKGTGFDNYLTMIECALHTARDLQTLIDYFERDSRVNMDRVGATGFSMGGFTTYLAACMHPQITAAAPMGAYPEIARRWHDAVIEATAYDEWVDAMEALHVETQHRESWLREIEPASQMLFAYRKALFMLCGDQDLDAHKSYTVPFYSAMRPLYHARDVCMRLKIYDNVAHTITAEMIHDTVDFFITCL